MTAVLALVAGAATWATLDATPAGAATAGLGTAWAVQAGAYWTLHGRLVRGQEALRAWVAGVAARIAGAAVLAAAAEPAGWAMTTVLVAYGLAVVAGLMLEVLWLWKATGRPPQTTIDRRRE